MYRRRLLATISGILVSVVWAGHIAGQMPRPAGEVILVPAPSVVGAAAAEGDTGDTYVWVVERLSAGKGRVGKRPVEAAMLAEGTQIEIKSGLQASEEIVIRGVHRLEEGWEVLVGEE